jgi:predicted nucleotidyltransferase
LRGWLKISAFQDVSIFVYLSSFGSVVSQSNSAFCRIDGNEVPWDISAMRLGANEAKAVGEEVRRLDPAAEIYLYGSRANDSAKGGDIDLLVVSDTLEFRDVLRLRTRILDRIGWQQLDLLVRRRDQADEPLAAMAQETGIKL